MGLLDFVKDAGRKIFESDEEAAEKIEQRLRLIDGVQTVDCKYDNGVAYLQGECADQASRERAILVAGNLAGVEAVNSDGFRAPPPQPEEKAEIYQIEKGDTLWAIAKHHYGDGNAYQRIFEANRDVIEDPDKIFPGQKIRIPLE